MKLFLDQKIQESQNRLAEQFHMALYKRNDAEKAREYLRSRNISENLIKVFKIGWCPKDFSPEGQEILSGRVIFPIQDEYNGDVVAFSGRFPDKIEDLPEGAKHWINESYPKQFYLYGLNTALPEILKKDFVVIVEGQCDVIACYKFGLKNTVGTMGSALTDGHLVKLSRLTTNFVLMFDADEAGRLSSERTIELMKSLKKNRFKVLDIELKARGEEYDPDDFLNTYGIKPLVKHIKEKKAEIEALK